MGALLVSSARADDWNRKTVVIFSAPLEIPSVHLAGWGVLPVGTYVFKILDSQSDCHIVRIFSKDEPEALRAWFYPGGNWGKECVYPKAKAIALAQRLPTYRSFLLQSRFLSKSPSRPSRRMRFW
jgi:hypothetical protein